MASLKDKVIKWSTLKSRSNKTEEDLVSNNNKKKLNNTITPQILGKSNSKKTKSEKNIQQLSSSYLQKKINFIKI